MGKTKVDIIVEMLGTDSTELQRLVWLDKTVRDFGTRDEENPDNGEMMDARIVAEWFKLQERYYKLALEKKLSLNESRFHFRREGTMQKER